MSQKNAGLRIAADEVHVWHATLGEAVTHDARWDGDLSADERERASRFAFPHDRARFVAGRRLLRAVLGRYLRRPGATIRFSYGPQGKPMLHPADSNPPIRFSVAHSQGLAVIAVSRAREVGVDVEAIRAGVAEEDIAERFFSPEELRELRSLPQPLRREGFFLCWTRKEAYLKALGCGLSEPLDSFTVTLTPGAPARLRGAEGARWRLRSFQPAPGYAGAVVADGDDWVLRFFECEESLDASLIGRSEPGSR